MERCWSLGQASWAWPDDVDETACAGRMADRYLPIEHTGCGGSGWQIAKVFVDEDDAEMLADARLIAAAPELLAALRLAVDALDYAQAQVDSASDRQRLLHWRTQVQNAISLAEGRTDDD